MKKLVAAMALMCVWHAVWAGGVHKAKSAEVQPLISNWDSGVKGCGLRLIVVTDIPAALHVLDTSLNIFMKDQKYWGAVKGGYARLEQGGSKGVALTPLGLESINFLFGNGNRVNHDSYKDAETPGHRIAGSEPFETANYLLEIVKGVEVMVAVKLVEESTSRIFRFNPVFEPGDAAVFQRCMGGLAN